MVTGSVAVLLPTVSVTPVNVTVSLWALLAVKFTMYSCASVPIMLLSFDTLPPVWLVTVAPETVLSGLANVNTT